MSAKHHAYIVKWRDSATHRGWQHIHGDHEVATITSVGWMVKQSAKDVTITTCISDGGSVREALTIPREAITKMVRLRNYVAGG